MKYKKEEKMAGLYPKGVQGNFINSYETWLWNFGGRRTVNFKQFLH